MVKIYQFEDVIAWQKAKILCIQVYKNFKYLKDYSFKDQIQRASVSVLNNIAEGFERNTNKELKNFLYIAKGSAGEVRSMIILAKELRYIDNIEYKSLLNQSLETSRIISGLLKTL